MGFGLIGRKIGMTNIFMEDGESVSVTIIEAGPCPVIRLLQKDQGDTHDAVQLGFKNVARKNLIKPIAGQFGKNVQAKRYLREFRSSVHEDDKFKLGDVLHVDFFKVGEKVDVRGTSIGHGTSGTIKRHNFHGGPGGHGSNFHRIPGSIGQGADPGKVWKGKPMAGRDGNAQVCVQNLSVVFVDLQSNAIGVRGSVPGCSDGIVRITRAAKKKIKKGQAVS